MKASIYTEVVYKEQDSGVCKWIGRVYNRVGPASVLETYDGIAPSRAEAVAAAKEWATNTIEQNTDLE